MRDTGYVPGRTDVIWLEFDPSKGSCPSPFDQTSTTIALTNAATWVSFDRDASKVCCPKESDKPNEQE